MTPGLGSDNKVLLLDTVEDREEFESVITFDYNQINPDSPTCSTVNPMRIASIQFNTMNVIGKLNSALSFYISFLAIPLRFPSPNVLSVHSFILSFSYLSHLFVFPFIPLCPF